MILIRWPNLLKQPTTPLIGSLRRRCYPRCSDADFEVHWFGDRTCWSCRLPIGEPDS